MDSDTHNMQSDMAAVKADLAKARQELLGLSHTLIDAGGKSAKAVKETVVSAASASAKKADEYVHSHPVQTALIAFGVGALVGGLVGTKLAHRRNGNGVA